MKAAEYAPSGPLEREPGGPHTTAAERGAVIEDALRGIEMGAHDDRIIGWLARSCDDPTCRTVVSWLLRAREAGRAEGQQP